jgi:hypothetical protein
MFETILETATMPTEISFSLAFLSIIVALLLGIVISGSYFIITPKKDRTASFTMSLIILPTIVAVVIILIGGNIARAFSMAGIFTIVRFRSVPGDSKDISYVFLTMAVGLAIGLGYLTFGAVIAGVLGLAIIAINKSGYGVSKQKESRLKIVIPEDMNYQGAFDDLFAKYTSFNEIQKVKTTNMGTLFELHYDIVMKKEVSEKEFIDAIRCRNGNLNIQLGIKESNLQQL